MVFLPKYGYPDNNFEAGIDCIINYFSEGRTCNFPIHLYYTI